jgi:hypothetical protein
MPSHKNVSVDAEAQAALDKAKERLARRLGFTPTLSQTIKYLATHFEDE